MVEQRSQNVIDIRSFQQIIWDYYKVFGRTFAWRQTTDPYHIVVSEVMLQQTQTHRVKQKYPEFIDKFASFEKLSITTIKDIITEWTGLGYNRRALYLQQIAQKVCHEYGGILPDDHEVLVQFPGIGKATAASICAFAFNKPTVFIETNIRTVFIHFFFQDQLSVSDGQILPLIEQSVDTINPRQWYYALMDYGVMLKQQLPNPSRKSVHHTTQSKFEGSDRQIRGKILKLLTQHEILEKIELFKLINKKEERTAKIVEQLCIEGFVIVAGNKYKLKE